MPSSYKQLSIILEKSIDKGLDKLCSKSADGNWQGFPTLAGNSNIWVTGFIVSHLKSLRPQHPIISSAQQFLISSMQHNKGWSYSAIVPSDADSTAWCIMALSNEYSMSTELLNQSKVFLWSHYKDIGMATYRLDSGISQFIDAPNEEAVQGWTSPHPDVSVAAILADPTHSFVKPILDWLYSLENDQGFIESYWWRSPLYTTTLMLRALNKNNKEIPEPLVKKIKYGLKMMQLRDGGFSLDTESSMDSFSTALALEAFVRLGANNELKPEMDACVEALLHAQTPQGDWKGNYILRIPAPYVLNPNEVEAYDNPDRGGNSLIEDKGGLFATTLSCYALDLYNKKIADKPLNTLFK